jgi:hypothetical protein
VRRPRDEPDLFPLFGRKKQERQKRIKERGTRQIFSDSKKATMVPTARRTRTYCAAKREDEDRKRERNEREKEARERRKRERKTTEREGSERERQRRETDEPD